MESTKTRILWGALALAIIGFGFTGCPNGNGTSDPEFQLVGIRITGIPFGINLQEDPPEVAPDTPAMIIMNAPGGAGGFAILNASVAFPDAGVPEISPDMVEIPGVPQPVPSNTSTAMSPLFGNVLGFLPGLMATPPQSIPSSLPSITVTGFSGNFSVAWVTYAGQHLGMDGMMEQMSQNNRAWLNVPFSNIDADGILTLDWADGQDMGGADNGTSDRELQLAGIRITGIPFGINLQEDPPEVAPDTPAMILINAMPGIQGFAILNALEEFGEEAGVPEIAPDMVEIPGVPQPVPGNTSTATSPLFQNVLGFLPGLMGDGPPTVPPPLPPVTVSGFSGNFSVSWVTYAGQHLDINGMMQQILTNTRAWLDVSFSNIDENGILTLNWADGQ